MIEAILCILIILLILVDLSLDGYAIHINVVTATIQW